MAFVLSTNTFTIHLEQKQILRLHQRLPNIDDQKPVRRSASLHATHT
jgi:hypothetical protein